MKQSKVGDFFIGMFGVYILSALIGGALVGLKAYAVASAAPAVLSIGLAIAAFARKRPYIALGIVSAWVIPILAFGACMLLFSGSYH